MSAQPEPSTEVVWKDPPPITRKGRPQQYPEILNALRENEGRWALWPGVYHTNTPSSHARLRKQGFEVVMRRSGAREWRMYVRWPEPKRRPLTIAEGRGGARLRALSGDQR